MQISQQELIGKLLALKGAEMITFTARTDTRCKAKDKDKNVNPFPRPVMKTSTVNGCVNFWYDAGVLRRLQKEGKSPDEFKRGESWHVPVMIGDRLTPLCQSKNEENRNNYIRFMYIKTVGEPAYEDDNGIPVAAEHIAPFLPPKNEYANQGLDAPLRFHTYDLNNVLSITFQGQTYELDRQEQDQPEPIIALAS